MLTPNTYHNGDRVCWINWAQFQFQNGFSKTYSGKTDYLPFYHFILNIYAKVCGSMDVITNEINRLKYVTYLFELGSTILLFKILNDKFQDFFKSLFYSLFYLLNFSVLYNSAIWGQVDGIMTFFVFSALFFAYFNKPTVALMLFVLAVNSKLQAIFFIPLLLYILAVNFDKKNIKKYLLGILLSFVLQLLIVTPFYFNGDFSKMMNVVFNSVGKYPSITMNAYNIWTFVVSPDNFFNSDEGSFFGLTYHLWGLIYFFAASFLVLIIPFLKTLSKMIYNTKVSVTLNEVLLIGALIPLIFFYFNTQMHERYSHPAFIFIAAFSLLNRKYYILIISSTAYFLNLEDVGQLFALDNYYTLIFTPWFIALLYLLIIILLFFELFKIEKTFFKPKD
jgi:Gpi18-like mannosyltransferase